MKTTVIAVCGSEYVLLCLVKFALGGFKSNVRDYKRSTCFDVQLQSIFVVYSLLFTRLVLCIGLCKIDKIQIVLSFDLNGFTNEIILLRGCENLK